MLTPCKDLANIQVSRSFIWTAEEMDLSKDLQDWNNRLTMTSDTSFLTSLLSSLPPKSDFTEARCFYGQIMMENIHSETYSLPIDTYTEDPLKDTTFSTPLRPFLV